MLLSFIITYLCCGFCVPDGNYQKANPALTLDLTDSQEIDLGVLSSLYREYKLAVDDEDFRPPQRRVFHQNKAYEIHVKKLKEVNGDKWHNLEIKKSLLRNGATKLIYILNPVEVGTPNAYLSIDEFKDVLLREAKKNKEIPAKNTKKYKIRKSLNKNVNKRSKYIFVTKEHDLKLNFSNYTQASTLLSTANKKEKVRVKNNNANSTLDTPKKIEKTVQIKASTLNTTDIVSRNEVLDKKSTEKSEPPTATTLTEQKENKQSTERIPTESSLITVNPESSVEETQTNNITGVDNTTQDYVSLITEISKERKDATETEAQSNIETEEDGVGVSKNNTEIESGEVTDDADEETSEEETESTRTSVETEHTAPITNTVVTRQTYARPQVFLGG